MGQIQFRYNPMKRQFSVMAGIALGTPGRSPKETLGRWLQNEFIFDSGSNRTTITEPVAEQLGVRVDQLPLVGVGGITGIAKRPFLAEVDLWFLGDEFRSVRIEGVTILRTLREKRSRQSSGVRQQTITRMPAPNLLGTDAVEALGGRVTLDFKNKIGHIEW